MAHILVTVFVHGVCVLGLRVQGLGSQGIKGLRPAPAGCPSLHRAGLGLGGCGVGGGGGALVRIGPRHGGGGRDAGSAYTEFGGALEGGGGERRWGGTISSGGAGSAARDASPAGARRTVVNLPRPAAARVGERGVEWHGSWTTVLMRLLFFSPKGLN